MAIQEKIEDTSFILYYWEKLASDLPNKSLADLLFREIIRKWVDIRAKAFVSSYIAIIKRQQAKSKTSKKGKLSKSKEPSMRKTLS